MDLFTSFALIFALLFLINKYFFTFWKRNGYEQLEPTFLFGNISDLFLFRKSFADCFNNLYEKTKNHRFIGVYFSYKPALLINDPEIIQDILITNFSHFTDRGRFFDEKRDPISNHLFNVEGQKWRDLRVKFTPTFTSGKLKAMFPIMRDCGRDMQNFLLNSTENVFSFVDLFAKFTTNIIVSTAFGVENNCFDDPENVFRKISSRFSAASNRQHLVDIFSFLIPNVLEVISNIGVKSVDEKFSNFIYSFVERIVKYREENNVVRNDAMQMLIELKNQGYLSADKKENQEKIEKKISFDEMVAQVVLFFVAGFETSSVAMSFCLYELCKNPEHQKKAQDEIDRVFGDIKSFEDITYEQIDELKYLQCCLNETLRLYPALPTLMRKCVKDYKIPNSDLIIKKGTTLQIPIMAIQRDSEIFEDPLKFNPERFIDSPTGNGKGKGLFYAPFGDGPRHCIGMRMGKIVTKIGLACILWKLNVTFNDEKSFDEAAKFQKTQFFVRSEDPFKFRVSERKL